MTKKKTKSQYKKVAALIDRHGIPQVLIADLTGVWKVDVNAWLRGRISVSPEREAVIKQAVEDVVRVLKNSPYRPDLSRTKDVRRLIQQINDRQMQLALPLPEPEGTEVGIVTVTAST